MVVHGFRRYGRYGATLTYAPGGDTPPIIAVPDTPVADEMTPRATADTPVATLPGGEQIAPGNPIDRIMADNFPPGPVQLHPADVAADAAASGAMGKFAIGVGICVAIAYWLGK